MHRRPSHDRDRYRDDYQDGGHEYLHNVQHPTNSVPDAHHTLNLPTTFPQGLYKPLPNHLSNRRLGHLIRGAIRSAPEKHGVPAYFYLLLH